MLTPYSDFLAANIRLKRPVRLAVDAGNGTGGVAAGPVFERLGNPVRALHFEMDGRFPNHEPDPTVPGNMEELRNTVLSEGLELGIGFDGDADRIGVIDDRGNMLYGDMLMVVFAREILKHHPGATIIGEVKCSRNLYDDIRKRGGRPVMGKAGHSLIKQRLREEKAILAGEMSGHLFFADRYFGFDDALYAACRLLEIVSARGAPSRHTWKTCRRRSTRRKYASPARKKRSSSLSRPSGRPWKAVSRSSTWTVCGWNSTTAGGFSGRPTRGRSWSFVSRRRRRNGFGKSALFSRRPLKKSEGGCKRDHGAPPASFNGRREQEKRWRTK